MKIITPKRVVGVHHDPTKFFTIRVVHVEGMQESLCPDGKEIYEKDEERKRACEENLESTFINRLKPDSEEQLRYNDVINSILDYKDYDEYKCKTSFKYKVMKFLKLTK
jgi:hypothetical protein